MCWEKIPWLLQKNRGIFCWSAWWLHIASCTGLVVGWKYFSRSAQMYVFCKHLLQTASWYGSCDLPCTQQITDFSRSKLQGSCWNQHVLHGCMDELINSLTCSFTRSGWRVCKRVNCTSHYAVLDRWMAGMHCIKLHLRVIPWSLSCFASEAPMLVLGHT